MIRNTFCTLDGVGEKTERRIWQEGLLTWDDFLDAPKVLGFGTERKRLFDESLFLDRSALDARDAAYFRRRVKIREHWRLFDFFRDSAVCLDIETNGYQPQAGGVVTLVGLYDGFDYRCLVRGENLTAENLVAELAPYKCLITFYGAAFDIPFLLRSFGRFDIDMPHFDLCFAAKRLKMQGGLKKLEQSLGIEREDDVKGLTGYDAVRLWELGRKGSREALDLLIAYNREDTVNLLRLADILYGMLRTSTGIAEYLPCGTA
ncbi:MAG: ribonuclease H-like domain-containing protein [Thermodesulfovibrionales bacterium]